MDDTSISIALTQRKSKQYKSPANAGLLSFIGFPICSTLPLESWRTWLLFLANPLTLMLSQFFKFKFNVNQMDE